MPVGVKEKLELQEHEGENLQKVEEKEEEKEALVPLVLEKEHPYAMHNRQEKEYALNGGADSPGALSAAEFRSKLAARDGPESVQRKQELQVAYTAFGFLIVCGFALYCYTQCFSQQKMLQRNSKAQ